MLFPAKPNYDPLLLLAEASKADSKQSYAKNGCPTNVDLYKIRKELHLNALSS